MIINIPQKYINYFQVISKIFPLKIIKNLNKGSLVFINGKKIELPVTLNPKFNYSAKIINNKIEIFEIKKNIIEKGIESSKNNITDLFDNFFNETHEYRSGEINNIFYTFFNYLDKSFNKNYNKKKKYIILKKDNKINIFLNINFFDIDSKFFINFNNFDLRISILVDNLSKIYKEQFCSDIRSVLKNKIKELMINFFEKKIDFYENIKNQLYLNKIDFNA